MKELLKSIYICQSYHKKKSSTSYSPQCIINSKSAKLQTNSVLLGQVLDHRCWIGSHGQQADHWSSGVTLLPHGFQVQDDWVGILWSHWVGDVLARLCRRSVWAPRSSIHTHRQLITHPHLIPVNVWRISTNDFRQGSSLTDAHDVRITTNMWPKGAITSKIKHAIKHKTSPAGLDGTPSLAAS